MGPVRACECACVEQTHRLPRADVCKHWDTLWYMGTCVSIPSRIQTRGDEFCRGGTIPGIDGCLFHADLSVLVVVSTCDDFCCREALGRVRVAALLDLDSHNLVLEHQVSALHVVYARVPRRADESVYFESHGDRVSR